VISIFDVNTHPLKASSGRPINTRTLLARAVFNVTSAFVTGRRFDWDSTEMRQLATWSDTATDMEAAGLYNFVPIFSIV
jgi:hypothetical protein